MKKLLFIGEKSLFQYFQSLEAFSVQPYEMNVRCFPRICQNFNGVIIQAELVAHRDLFYNIKMTLPYLLMFEFKVRPIILTGFLPKSYFEDKYKLPFDIPNCPDVNLGVQYLKLPVIENVWEGLEKRISIPMWGNLCDSKQRWKPFFRIGNFGSEVDHMVKQMQLEDNEDFLLFNKYRNKYQWT